MGGCHVFASCQVLWQYYVVARVFWEVAIFVQLLVHCYAVARVFWVVAMSLTVAIMLPCHCYSVFWLPGSRWLPDHCYELDKCSGWLPGCCCEATWFI